MITYNLFVLIEYILITNAEFYGRSLQRVVNLSQDVCSLYSHESSNSVCVCACVCVCVCVCVCYVARLFLLDKMNLILLFILHLLNSWSELHHTNSYHADIQCNVILVLKGFLA